MFIQISCSFTRNGADPASGLTDNQLRFEHEHIPPSRKLVVIHHSQNPVDHGLADFVDRLVDRSQGGGYVTHEGGVVVTGDRDIAGDGQIHAPCGPYDHLHRRWQ